jgi:hypothetical protein
MIYRSGSVITAVIRLEQMQKFDRIRDISDPRLSTTSAEIVRGFSEENSRFYIDAGARIRHVWVARGFTDADLQALLELKHLISFAAFDVHQPVLTLTANAPQLLSRHSRICAISIRNCPNITIESLEPIFENKWIRWLGFGGPTVTDQICRSFDRMTHMLFLNLSYSHLTDESVDKFACLQNLRHLTIRKCGISSDGIERIRELLPRCKIHTGIAE